MITLIGPLLFILDVKPPCRGCLPRVDLPRAVYWASRGPLCWLVMVVPVPRCEATTRGPPCCLVLRMTCTGAANTAGAPCCLACTWSSHLAPSDQPASSYNTDGCVAARVAVLYAQEKARGPPGVPHTRAARVLDVALAAAVNAHGSPFLADTPLAVRLTCTAALPVRWGSDHPRLDVRLRRGALSASSVSPSVVVLHPLFVASHSWRSRRRRRRRRAACVSCTSPYTPPLLPPP